VASIKFIIQSSKNPATIYVRLSIGRGIDLKSKTNYVINPNDWSTKKGKPILKDENLKSLDANLSQFNKNLLESYNRSVHNGDVIDAKWLKNFITPNSPISENIVPDTLVGFIDYYIKTKETAGVVKYNTIKSYKSHRNRINQFQTEVKKQFMVYDINEDFQARFNAYSLKLKYSYNSTARIVKWLKQIGNNAASYGIKTHLQINSIKVNFEKIPIVYLTKSEVEKIHDVDLDKDYLSNARDWLIIGIETGQRVSDYLNFNKCDVEKIHNVDFIKFTQKKTGKLMTIPLSNRVKVILDKRNGEFPRKISDVKFNDYIKQVGKIAKINDLVNGKKKNPLTNKEEFGTYPKYELITSKIARKTFCSMYYGIKPTAEIMLMSGHTTEKALRDYIGKTDVEQQKILSAFFN
jgi:integrase